MRRSVRAHACTIGAGAHARQAREFGHDGLGSFDETTADHHRVRKKALQKMKLRAEKVLRDSTLSPPLLPHPQPPPTHTHTHTHTHRHTHTHYASIAS